MSEFVTLECKYCGNASRSSFVLRDGEYICKCCGRAYRENATGTEARSVMGFETLKNYDFEAAENIFTRNTAESNIKNLVVTHFCYVRINTCTVKGCKLTAESHILGIFICKAAHYGSKHGML